MDTGTQKVVHEPCPKCGSKNNLGRYPDGHAYCFGSECDYMEYNNSDSKPVGKVLSTSNGFPKAGNYEPLNKRGISQETCRFFGYKVGKLSGSKVHIAPYYNDEGELIAQQLRTKNKDFPILGEARSLGLWGKQCWTSGKYIVITEGQIDAMSVAEVNNCKYPVVSIPNGVGSACKAVSKDLEWILENFQEVVLMFDSDPQGKSTARKVAELFPPGRCKIASLPLKDANEMLKEDRGSEVVNAIFRASTYRPDGIIAGEDTWELVNIPMQAADMEYPWQGLNNLTLGARKGELVTFCAGTGVGKSTAVKEIASYFLSKGETIGYIALEESVRQASIDFMSIEANKMLHLQNDLDEKYLRDIWEKTLNTGRIYLYDHWGSLDGDILANRIRYLVRSCSVSWIIIDHISIMISGMEGGDERRLIDNLMTKLRSLAEELNIGMFIVSHLKKPSDGRGHEDGRKITLNDVRGSGSISQLSDFVIGLERNQQEDGETTVRILKARYKGSTTGIATKLYYDRETGRLRECGTFDAIKTKSESF